MAEINKSMVTHYNVRFTEDEIQVVIKKLDDLDLDSGELRIVDELLDTLKKAVK